MSRVSQAERRVRLSVENIGGISETEVEFDPGVNVLSGRNATNRTSLLRAIMAALGSDDVSLKSDADEGVVELRLGDETYTRRFVRENGTVKTDGNPYMDDPALGDLFAFLLATNEPRRAVLTEQNLRELIMRPVDTAAIQSEIASLEDEKSRLDDELSDLSELEQRKPRLETEREDLTERLRETEAALEAKREEIEEADASVDESRDEKRELEEQLSTLGDLRSELGTVRRELRAQRQSLESLQGELAELEQDAAELPEAAGGEIEAIDTKIGSLRDRKQALQSEINTLQRIIQFNEDNLDGASTDVLEALTDAPVDSNGGAVTDRLVEDSETVVCWTCGHEVEQADIEETLDRLRDLRQSKLAESNDLDDRIDELTDERLTYEEKQRQRKQVRRQLRRTEEQVEDRRERIEDLEARRASLEDEIGDVEGVVEELQTESDDEILSLHKEANQLEVDLNRLESEREEIEQRLADLEAELGRRDDLESRREEVTEELTALRTRIERIESEAVESFNHHMETVLDALEYDNLARIWIERTESEVPEGRGTVSERDFTLHVVRESESGAAYEDTIRHLSESEREVTGIVFALAGYLVHDVHDRVPFMLLDSLEAIDSDRIAKLLEYFEDYPTYLVAALLPEDAAPVEDEYSQITDI